MTPRKRGRKKGVPDERDIWIRELERDKERLTRKLKKAEIIIEFPQRPQRSWKCLWETGTNRINRNGQNTV